jgi:two-component system OmpR family sensor kinase
MTSIRKALLWTLLPAILLLLAVAVLAVLHEVRDEIDELFDAQLARAAHAIPATPDPQPAADADEEDDPTRQLVIAVWNGAATAPVYHSLTRAPLQRASRPGFSTRVINGEPWRIFVSAIGEQTIQVAQPVRIRTEASAEIASRIALPMLLLVPIVVLAVLWLLKRGLRPLSRFAEDLDSRSHSALESVPLTGLPAELLPMATAINDLLARLRAALSAQQVFVADATHELLTPLTALQVQVQMLERAKSEDRRSQATRDVRASLERCITLARQLLTLARHTGDTPSAPSQSMQLGDVVRAAMSDVLPKAHARRIDLGIASETACAVVGEPKALQTLLGNLMDNAVKYSPVAGRVDVSIDTRGNQPRVTVSDTGPGISTGDQARVFDRFYRSTSVDVEGSGLGLAIAREIAATHGAKIELRTPGQLGGLDVEVIFSSAAEPETGLARPTGPVREA